MSYPSPVFDSGFVDQTAVIAPVGSPLDVLAVLERFDVFVRDGPRVAEQVGPVVQFGNVVQADRRERGLLDGGAAGGDAVTAHEASL